MSQTALGRSTSVLSHLFGGSVTVQATGRFLRRELWAWPILAALVLGIAGWWVNSAVESTLRDQRANTLTTILNADVAALHAWMENQRKTAELIMRDQRLLPLVQELLALSVSEVPPGDRESATNPGPDVTGEDSAKAVERALKHAQVQARFRAQLADHLKIGKYTGFILASPQGVIVASDQDSPVGKPLVGYRQEFYGRVSTEGVTAVSKPFRSLILLEDDRGEFRANLPTMLVGAPVRDATGTPIAAIGFRVRPDEEFTRILQVARTGESGETYAFDDRGLLLSQSRFDDDLKRVGLLADLPDSQSILTLELRDPGVNMMEGNRPDKRRHDQPLNRMAAEAVTGRSGVDVDGYRDYRGVPVVGAWTWLTEYDFGVCTEINVSEIYTPVYILRMAFRILMGLLAVSAFVTFVAMLFIARQQKTLQAAVLEARQLGQYTLEEKLGAGTMGTVYKARHKMLRRPTAVKLLNLEQMSDFAIARFEREVQLTSALTHPNTVAIFDYGSTPEGIFYYVMEYLEGLNLDDLVARAGPLSEARTVHLLKQICGSLAEAHQNGLIHRDIKPANIILTNRGGIPDFVKVLDFGLAKAVENTKDANLTSANAITGTPLYMSPEAVNQPDAVDAASDVYAIGAVGYYLLTGAPLFTGSSILEICMKQVQETPVPPSTALGKPISKTLETLIMRCLVKAPKQRPSNASVLLRDLETCSYEGYWNNEIATVWWEAHTDLQASMKPVVSEWVSNLPNTNTNTGTGTGTGTGTNPSTDTSTSSSLFDNTLAYGTPSPAPVPVPVPLTADMTMDYQPDRIANGFRKD